MVRASPLAAIIGLGFTSFAWRTIMADLGSPLPLAAGMRVFYLPRSASTCPARCGRSWRRWSSATPSACRGAASALGGLVFVGLHCATGLLVATGPLPFADRESAGRYWWLLALTPVLLVICTRGCCHRCSTAAFRILKREPLDRPLTFGNTLRACGFLLVTWLFYGLSLLALAGPLGLTGAGSLALATGAYALAWSAGVMVLGWCRPGSACAR